MGDACDQPMATPVADECAVCQDEMEGGDVRTIAYGCGHRFHSNCILDWVLREHFQCPVCRAEVVDAERGLFHESTSERLLQILIRVESLARLAVTFFLSCMMAVASTVHVFVRVLNSMAIMCLSALLLLYLVVVIFSWLFDLSLTNGSRLCFHARSIFPLVELHVAGLVHLLGHPGGGTDGLTLLVFASLRNLILCVLDTARFVLDSELLCGA